MSQFITLPVAIEMTSLYRQNREAILAPNFQGKNILAFSETFDRIVFDTLLAKPGCASIRVYYGMDESLKVHAILVPVDADNHDILPAQESSATTETTGDDIGEQGRRCPVDCPPPSPLTD